VREHGSRAQDADLTVRRAAKGRQFRRARRLLREGFGHNGVSRMSFSVSERSAGSAKHGVAEVERESVYILCAEARYPGQGESEARIGAV